LLLEGVALGEFKAGAYPGVGGRLRGRCSRRALAGAFLANFVDEIREHSRPPFAIGAQSAQSLAYFVGVDIRVIEKRVDFLADAPGYVARQRWSHAAAVFIEQGIAEEGGGASRARLARYRSPSLLNYPLNYPLRSETLMSLSRGALTCMFRVNAVYARNCLMRLSRECHESVVRQGANGIFRDSGMLRALMVSPLRRVQVTSPSDGKPANGTRRGD